MPLTIRKFNTQLRDPNSGQMIPAGLLSSDSLEAIENAETAAVEAVAAAGVAATANFPVTADACDTLAGDFAATFVPNQAYTVGDYCTYQYQLYQCKTAIALNADSSFVASHWNLITVTDTLNDQVGELKNAMDGVIDGKNLIFYDVVPNSYPTLSGFSKYNGWNRSDYIPVSEGEIININNPSHVTNDNVWYNSEKEAQSKFSIPIGSPATITVPDGISYMVISNDASMFFGDVWRKIIAYANREEFDSLSGDVDDVESVVYTTNVTNASSYERDGLWIKLSGEVTSSSNYSAARIPIHNGDKKIIIKAPTDTWINFGVFNANITGVGDYASNALFIRQIVAGGTLEYDVIDRISGGVTYPYNELYYYICAKLGSSGWASTDAKVTYINDNIADLKSKIEIIDGVLYKTTTCIDSTDTGSYETAPSTVSKAHPFGFVKGKTYKATLTINSGSFIDETNGLRVQQSSYEGTSTTGIISGGYVFQIDHPVVGATYTSEFVALEGCVNLLARYKWSTGAQSVDLDVTITESIDTQLNDLSDDVNIKYNDCIIKSRMLMGAHRGAEHYAPPNCVAAYEIAGKMGFSWAWLAQVRYSADNTLYVMHDEDVSVTTNGTGNMADLTDEYIDTLLCNKLSGYDYSQFSSDDLRVPTLEKAIQICLRYGMKMCFRIEPLPASMSTERSATVWTNFQTLIKAYGIGDDWACYSGYNASEMMLCRTLINENAELCPYIGSVSAQDVIDWFTDANISGNRSVLLPASSLTLNDIKTLHTNGIKVYAYTGSTTPTQEQMENLAMWGADILQNPTYARIPLTT